MAEMAFFESHFNGKHDCLLTDRFCALSKQIGTDTVLNVNEWSGWPRGHSGLLFLLGDYL